MSLKSDSITAILAKPNKTTDDLQEIVNLWHDAVSQSENDLLQHAHTLNDRQQQLDKTTSSFIETQDLLSEIEQNLDIFQTSIETLTKYNDELEKSIKQLDQESRDLLPSFTSNTKAEQDRSAIYELMEKVDDDLNELTNSMASLNDKVQENTDKSIITTVDDLENCFRDALDLEETMKQIKS